jgi:predicted dehydrogenase/nucleoside-diphosphate-sugar epimerase
MQFLQRCRLGSRGGDPLNNLSIGIIGCGRIAEHHLRFIKRTKGARVVALSDPDVSNARRYATQYEVANVYSGHAEMLNCRPLDVVHILTPPELHYSQALDAIDRGVHVLIEKPCTSRPQELEELYLRADAKGVRLCPDFIQLFNPSFLKGASLIDSGRLGKVVHIETHLSVDLNTPELREAMRLPWRFNLPGGILHDNITHPLYISLRWLGNPLRVSVSAQAHHVLPQGLTDHLSIMLEGKYATANVVLSGVIKPEPYYVQVFCERGSVLIDFDNLTTLVTRYGVMPRFLRRAVSNFDKGFQLFAAGIGNMIKFACGKLLAYQGLENLIPRFYECIRAGGEVPVSRQLAISVARAEAKIFAQAGKLHLDTSSRPSRQRSVSRYEKVLLTGATGYLGSVVARKLVDEGYYVRALVRQLSHTEKIEKLGIELVYGDIRNTDSVVDAGKGMDIIIHAAAALNGGSDFVLDCAIKGTKNVAAAAKYYGLKRVIYISSMSVYDCVNLSDGEVISEHSPLEEFAELRGTYSLAKRRAEDEALAHLDDGPPPWTILRPSIIVGEKHNVVSPVGKQLRNFLFCFGSKTRMLRLIHVEDVARAIAIVIQSGHTAGRVFNLTGEGVGQQEFIDQFVRRIGYDDLRVVYVPYSMAWAVACVLSGLRQFSGKIPNINKRRLASLYRSVGANSDALRCETGWQPRKNLLQMLVAETQGSNIITPDCMATVARDDLAIKNNAIV